MVMVGHLQVPQVISDDTPASLSSEMITDVLRNELGYDGIVITDSLSMGAITTYYTSADAAVKCIQAGGRYAADALQFYGSLSGSFGCGKQRRDF